MINNPFRKYSHNWIILNGLQSETVTVTTAWMMSQYIGSHTRRISDIRKKLEKVGYMVEGTKITNSKWEYHIVPLEKEIKRSPLSWIRELCERFFCSASPRKELNPSPSGASLFGE
jgi:hypothetical protein